MKTSSVQWWLQTAWRQTVRDARSGQLRLLLISVVWAVAALSAVAFFADRLQAGLWRDARQLLGGDAVIVSDQPAPAAFTAEADRRGLAHNESLSFPTMARWVTADPASQDQAMPKLVALKAVSTGYPLRGAMDIRQGSEVALQRGALQPERGTVWVEPALLSAWGAQVGDALALGQQVFRIAALIEREPDRGAGFINFAPRVMMNRADLASTGLVQAASRVTYRLAVAAPSGNEEPARLYAAWAQEHIRAQALRGVQIESLEGGRPEMQQTLNRAEKFLRLVAMLTALLCAVALALAARSFAQTRLDTCAMQRVMGLSQKQLMGVYALEFVLLAFVASGVGVLLGWGLHHALVVWLGGLLDVQLPAASLQPVALGLSVGLVLLATFGLPPVLQLARVPALRVMRRDLGAPQWSSLLVSGVGGLGFTALLLLVSADWKLGLWVTLGFAVAVGGFAALALLALRALPSGVRLARWPHSVQLAVQQWRSHSALTVMQVTALSVGLLALALLVLVRTDLLDTWRAASPKDAPNRFVINIQPEQAADFEALLKERSLAQYDWYPMYRARLVAVNERAVHESQYSEERAKRLVDREFNLSFAAQAPAHNRVVAGRWNENTRGEVSVEEGLAQTLGLKLGDRLQFDVAGQLETAAITSLRKVDWASMRANFFVMHTVARAEDVAPALPLTYLAAFHLGARDAAQLGRFDAELVARFPNVTVVDLTQTLAQVERVLNQVVTAVQALFMLTLTAGVLVMFAALAATRSQREREWAILRALGATRALLTRVQRIELLGMGALAGGMASSLALLLAWGVARAVFELDWPLKPWVPLAGALLGAVLAAAAGWWSLRNVLRQPVVQTLRQS